MKLNILKFFFLFSLVIAYLAIDSFYAIERFNGIYSIPRKVVFVGQYVFAILSLYYIAKLNSKVALPILLIVWVFILADVSIYKITGQTADIFYISAMNAAARNMTHSLVEFRPQIISSIITTSLLMVLLIVKNLFYSGIAKQVSRVYVLFGSLFLAYGFILFMRGAPALVGFPKGFSYVFGSAFLVINDLIQDPATKTYEKVNAYTSQPQFKKVVVIIDESIEYNEFASLNKTANSNVVDFGLAYSAANCSAGSNYIIRRATWDTDKSNSLNLKSVDSLFSLAKKGGYKTIYLDNQDVLHDGAVKNYFDDEEIDMIDMVISRNADQELHNIDTDSLKHIEKALQNDKVFIFTNKVGVHFPYRDFIPEDLISTDRMSNYRAAIERSTNTYLKKLATIIDDETIVFYTSDHGQNFNSVATHCSTGNNISKHEYSVPFLVMSKDNAVTKSLKLASIKHKNKLSHLEFSESIRNSIGFELENKASIFKLITSGGNFCGLYGQPQAIFGVEPACRELYREVILSDSSAL